MMTKWIGMVIMIDGIISMTIKSNNHSWYVDSMRLIRIILGGVLFFI